MRALQARATVRVHGPYGGRGPMLSYGFARPGGPRAPAHHLFPVHLNDGSGLRDTRGTPMQFARLAALVTLSLLFLATPLATGAQPTERVHRIGILSPSPAYSGRVEAIRQGLRVLGYVEGRNMAIEYRVAKAEADLPALAVELVRLGVDLIVK